jgi:hypothetical protein
MRIFPTKEQYQKWSLPSKFSYWGVILAVISIVIALVFEGNPFKEVIGIDNTKKSLQLLEIAKKNRVDQDFAKMLSNSKKAVQFDDNASSVEFLGFAYVLNDIPDSAATLLLDYEHDLSAIGQWALATSLAKESKFSEACERFDRLDLGNVPIEIRIDALSQYLTSSSRISYEKLTQTAQKILIYIDHEEDVSHLNNRLEILPDGRKYQVQHISVKISLPYVNTTIYLPGVYFYIGSLLALSRQSVINFNERDLLVGMGIMKKGFSSGLLSYTIESYINFFNRVYQINTIYKIKNRQEFIPDLLYFKNELVKAVNNQLDVDMGSAKGTLTQDRIEQIKLCIGVLDNILRLQKT